MQPFFYVEVDGEGASPKIVSSTVRARARGSSGRYLVSFDAPVILLSGAAYVARNDANNYVIATRKEADSKSIFVETFASVPSPQPGQPGTLFIRGARFSLVVTTPGNLAVEETIDTIYVGIVERLTGPDYCQDGATYMIHAASGSVRLRSRKADVSAYLESVAGTGERVFVAGEITQSECRTCEVVSAGPAADLRRN